jgi:hypothetical protein
MTKHRLLALALASALALSAGACSSDSEPTPKKAEYLKKADALCVKSDKVIEKLGKGVSEDSPKAELEAYYKKAAEESLNNIGEVRDLGFPEGDKAKLDEHFKVFESAFEALKASPEKFDSITEARGPKLDAASQALFDYGLKECGSESSDS